MPWLVRFDPFSYSSEILSMSLLSASFMKIQQKNEAATLFTRSIMAIFDNLWHVSLRPLLVWSDSFLNLSEILCISLLYASFTKIQWKMKKLRCSQAFSYSTPMGPISYHRNQSSDSIFLKGICKQSPYHRHATDIISWVLLAGCKDIPVLKCGRRTTGAAILY